MNDRIVIFATSDGQLATEKFEDILKLAETQALPSLSVNVFQGGKKTGVFSLSFTPQA